MNGAAPVIEQTAHGKPWSAAHVDRSADSDFRSVEQQGDVP